MMLKLRWAALFAALVTLQGLAQGFPSKPIRLVWAFPAGTPIEAPVRALAEESGKLLGQPMIIDFQLGAGGRIAVNAVQRAAPDGHTIGLIFDALFVVLPHASASYKVEPGRDYTPVMLTLETASLLSAHASLPFRDLKGLVAHAKANPGKLTFGSAGVGSTSHIYWERFMAATGTELTHIPYKGSGQALTDRLTGVCNLWMGAADIRPHMNTGKLVAIASSGTQRFADYPEVPTLEEQGMKGFTLKAWAGTIAPPGTPADVVAKLNGALNAALKTAEVRKRLADLGWVPLGSTPEAMTARIRADSETYAPIVRKIGLKVD